MTLRDWLHLVDIHYWGKWSKPVAGMAVNDFLGSKYPTQVQVAKCLICDQLRVRIVK